MHRLSRLYYTNFEILWMVVLLCVIGLNSWHLLTPRPQLSDDWNYLGRFQRTDWYYSQSLNPDIPSIGSTVKSVSGQSHSLQIPVFGASQTFIALLLARMIWWLITIRLIHSSDSKLAWLYMALPVIELYLHSLFLGPTHDDFFHLTISKANTIGEFLEFFALNPSHGFAHYRPVGTQLFYWLGQLGGAIWPLRVIHLSAFLLTAVVWYQTLVRLGWRHINVKVGIFVWMILATHASKLWFLGAFQEVSMLLFVSLCCYAWFRWLSSLNKYWLGFSLVTLVLALLSKEMALTTPALMLLLAVTVPTKSYPLSRIILSLLPIAAILLMHLLIRIGVYGVEQADTYIWNFSPTTWVNTVVWYGLWLLGVPESFVDFIGTGFRPLPQFFSVLGPYAYLVPMLMATCLVLLFNTVRSLSAKSWRVLSLAAITIPLSLVPVWFLPQHKFAFVLSMASVAFLVLILELLEYSFSKVLLLAFIPLQVVTHSFVSNRHWVIMGSSISNRVHTLLQSKVNQNTHTIVLVADSEVFSDEWGSVRQIELALSRKNALAWWFSQPLELESTSSATPNDPTQASVSSVSVLGY